MLITGKAIKTHIANTIAFFIFTSKITKEEGFIFISIEKRASAHCDTESIKPEHELEFTLAEAERK